MRYSLLRCVLHELLLRTTKQCMHWVRRFIIPSVDRQECLLIAILSLLPGTVRSVVLPWDADRYMKPDLDSSWELVHTGKVLAAVRPFLADAGVHL
jgi:hypothetical protein